jgi:hypothetical protein
LEVLPQVLRGRAQAFEKLHEVVVFREDDGGGGAGRSEDDGILGVAEAELAKRAVRRRQTRRRAARRWPGQLRVHPNDERAVGHTATLRSEDRMIEAATGEPEASGDIRQLKIGQLTDDLFRRESGGEQIEDIDDANAHPADAGAPAALLRRGILARLRKE